MTMDRQIEGIDTAEYLWTRKQVVPFLKVDKGLADEADGAQVMKPMPELDDLLARGVAKGVFGTKMRSVIKLADSKGVGAVVDQQFEVGRTDPGCGLVPIIEPEVDINSPQKAEAEALLKSSILSQLDQLDGSQPVMLKLTLPEADGFYQELVDHPNVLRVVALSGGYSREEPTPASPATPASSPASRGRSPRACPTSSPTTSSTPRSTPPSRASTTPRSPSGSGAVAREGPKVPPGLAAPGYPPAEGEWIPRPGQQGSIEEATWPTLPATPRSRSTRSSSASPVTPATACSSPVTASPARAPCSATICRPCPSSPRRSAPPLARWRGSRRSRSTSPTTRSRRQAMPRTCSWP
jgi:hypothetical protein